MAEAMAAYARQAKDSELIQYATEIKVRAERRCGELLRVTEKNTGARGQLAGKRDGLAVVSSDRQSDAPTLADMGLTRDESSRYQQLAAMPAEHFETAVATAKATAGEPWFVAADVCAALGIANSRDAVARLDDDEKGVATTDTLGGAQQQGTVNESGLYSLILGSRKPEAKRFKKWVTAEVLPAIRKTGSYDHQPGETLTMSSREIAELTGKEHKNVMADIRSMLEQIGVASAEFSADLPDSYGRAQPVFMLPKRETLILVSGYSVTMRARIIDRWQELESRQLQPADPMAVRAKMRRRFNRLTFEPVSATTSDVRRSGRPQR